MLDKNCIHHRVCEYSGSAMESCEKCKFREYYILDEDQDIVNVDSLYKAMNDHDFDVVESDGYGVTCGYSECAIRDMVDSCLEQKQETVGVCIEHELTEENGLPISNFECPYCGKLHKIEEINKYCSCCGKSIMIMRKN